MQTLDRFSQHRSLPSNILESRRVKYDVSINKFSEDATNQSRTKQIVFNQAISYQNSNWIKPELCKQLPQINFFRFCQWIERCTCSRLGEDSHIKSEILRFRPHPGMGFPVSELKSICLADDNKYHPPTVTTTFLGLYGVDSPLPTSYLDDISLQREGSESIKAFLDIFNHRITTQYYRIWKKYSYPASFKHGGSDPTSQCLLGLIGLGINGSANHLTTPLSRFLALLGPMCLPIRTAEGVHTMVKLLAPNTDTCITPYYSAHVEIDKPVQLQKYKSIQLSTRPVLGKKAIDCNTELRLELITEDKAEAVLWLFEGQAYLDLLILMRGYLAYRCTVKIFLTLPKVLIPQAQLKKKHIRLGRTAILGWKDQSDEANQNLITVEQTFSKKLGSNTQQLNNKSASNIIKRDLLQHHQIEEISEKKNFTTKICCHSQLNQWVTIRLGRYQGLTL